MISILISFLAFIGIAVVITIGSAAAGKLWRGKPWPPARAVVREILTTGGISVVITIVISLLLGWTGFLDSQFYRPSSGDYGEHSKLGLSPEDVFFESQDGTRLHGWFIPSNDPPVGTLIHFHGSDRNISWTIRNSHWLTEHGFNLFLFDYRGYGRSEGRPSPTGVVDDSVAAIDFVRSRPEVDTDKLLLWGQSMGGQLAIVAANRAGTEGVKAIVADATYASHSHHVKDKVAQMGPLWLIQWAVWLTTPDTNAAYKVVDRIGPTHLLVVHGLADQGVRPYHGEWLYSAAQEPKDIWRVEGAGHLEVLRDAQYQEQLVETLVRALQVD